MPAPPARRRRSRAGLLIGLGVVLVLAGTAFGADGGLRLQRTTVVEAIVMLLGASLCAAALLVPRARIRKLHGATTLLLVALLAAYTAVSVALVAGAVGLVDRGRADVHLPDGVRGDDGARAARARPLVRGAARDRARLRRWSRPGRC